MVKITCDEWGNKITHVLPSTYDFCLYARAQKLELSLACFKTGLMYWKSDLPRGAGNTNCSACLCVCMCVGALAKLNAGCCWICNSPLKRWGMPSSLRESEVLPGAQDEWCSCANIQHLFTHTKRRTKAKRWWSKYLGVRARASAACRVIYLFKGKRRARHKLKRRRDEKEHKNGSCQIFFSGWERKASSTYSAQIILNFLLFWGLKQGNIRECRDEKGVCCSSFWDESVHSVFQIKLSRFIKKMQNLFTPIFIM